MVMSQMNWKTCPHCGIDYLPSETSHWSLCGLCVFLDQMYQCGKEVTKAMVEARYCTKH